MVGTVRPAVFASARDAWIVALIWVGVVMTFVGGVAQLAGVEDMPPQLRFPLAALFLIAAGFMLWVLYGISYTLTDDELQIRCGPFRYRVPLAEIDSVGPSRNPLSSPAASLDRLLIKWRGGRKRILISPDRKADFLRQLDQRCEQLSRQGDKLVS